MECSVNIFDKMPTQDLHGAYKVNKSNTGKSKADHSIKEKSGCYMEVVVVYNSRQLFLFPSISTSTSKTRFASKSLASDRPMVRFVHIRNQKTYTTREVEKTRRRLIAYLSMPSSATAKICGNHVGILACSNQLFCVSLVFNQSCSISICFIPYC